MHEAGIAIEIYRAAQAAVGGSSAGCLERVTVAVGELSAVDPELLRFAWEALVAGGPDAGAQLEVRWCPATRHCRRCQETKPAADGSWLPVCPDCGEPLRVEGGSELDLVQVAYQAPE